VLGLSSTTGIYDKMSETQFLRTNSLQIVEWCFYLAYAPRRASTSTLRPKALRPRTLGPEKERSRRP
jgi:hypothetical protein